MIRNKVFENSIRGYPIVMCDKDIFMCFLTNSPLGVQYSEVFSTLAKEWASPPLSSMQLGASKRGGQGRNRVEVQRRRGSTPLRAMVAEVREKDAWFSDVALECVFCADGYGALLVASGATSRHVRAERKRK